MPDSPLIENEFLNQITSHVENHISNENFGVSELANEMNMSRSNLLRKVKKDTGLSVSQLIRQIRLNRAMEMLKKSSFNVSEISHQVGFSSTSYFIKCFREHYGYPPGEAGKRAGKEQSDIIEATIFSNLTPVPAPINRKPNFFLIGSLGLLIALAIGALTYFYWPSIGVTRIEKSIAVLPFKNDSNDSTNLYLINGLMESTLNNLQKIKDLKVISRTSAEKYRSTSRSIPEMGKELNVNYFVEGSGQKIGDQILLNIQLIEASSDKHLWAKQYKREIKDIFELQQEVAKNIAEEIQAIITPEEENRIKKNPTTNLVAYDLFLKGRDLFYKSDRGNMEASIAYFNKAIEQDNEFALAYANAAMVYYYLDIFQKDKKYGLEIRSYADKALQYDSKLGESLVAKALSYIHKKEYKRAVPYLEKALEYNPNSSLVINFLSEFYNVHIPNTAKYLEYAMIGVRIDIASHDSSTTSYKYLHLSNALLQSGFIEESLRYINKSLDYNPENPFSGYLKAYILLAKNNDINETKELLLKELSKDTTRIDVLQEVGKIYYSTRDYKNACKYYTKFIESRDRQHLDIFKNADLTIAFVFSKVGLHEKSEEFVKSYKDYVDHDQSIYKNLGLAMYFIHRGEFPKAIDHMKLFSKEDNFIYWVILFKDDPIVDPIKDMPEFKKVMSEIETKFWDTHKKIRATLEEKELL